MKKVEIIYCAYSIEGDLVGGLVGSGFAAMIEDSYTIFDSIEGDRVGGLVGSGFAAMIEDSYWDNDTGDMISGDRGRSSDALRAPTNATGIYENWVSEDGCGWDFGGPDDYPALKCLSLTPARQRALWRVEEGELTITR